MSSLPLAFFMQVTGVAALAAVFHDLGEHYARAHPDQPPLLTPVGSIFLLGAGLLLVLIAPFIARLS